MVYTRTGAPLLLILRYKYDRPARVTVVSAVATLIRTMKRQLQMGRLLSAVVPLLACSKVHNK